MGNLHDTFKGQTSMGNNDKDLQDMMKNKATEMFNEFDDPEYWNVPTNAILGQLFSWSLSEIKVVYDKYRRCTYFPLMDRTMFCKVMPLSKRNATYIFEILLKQGNPQYLPFFELMCILVLTAYGNSRNKLKMLFNMFDTVGNGSLPFPQWHIFVISFIQAYCRLVQKPFPKRSKLERVAKLIFIKIDVAPYNNALDYTEILDWVEGTPHLVTFLNRFEPAYTIKEKPTVYFSNKRYNDKQIEEMTAAILDYGTTGEESATKIQEMIQRSARADVYKKTILYQPGSRKSSLDSISSAGEIDGARRSAGSNSPPRFDFITEQTNTATSKFKSSTMQHSPKKTVVINTENSAAWPNLTQQSPSSNTHQPLRLMPRTTTLPKIIKNQEVDLIQIRKDLMTKSRLLIKPNVIITSGKSFTRSDIVNLRYYFDAIADGDDVMTLKDFVKSFAKNASLQKVSASLFNFLDDKAKGYINFPELVKKLYPGMKPEQLKLALEWSTEEENLEKSKGQKKYLEETKKRRGTTVASDKIKKNAVPKEGVKKLKYMFDMYDDEKKGYVSLENLKSHLGRLYTGQEIEENFKELDKDLDGKLNLKEFIDLILPVDFYIDPKYVAEAMKS